MTDTKLTEVAAKGALAYSVVSDTDSYKLSHWNQYPPGVSRMMSYFEARGGELDTCTLFGLQYLLHAYLSQPITRAQVAEQKAFSALHGEPFNERGWLRIVEHYQGRLPVRIRAVPEGTVVPVSNALLTIESVDDPECAWLVSWLETMLVRLWYPSTIAIMSRESKRILQHYLTLSADDPAGELGFKLHDFGARGVSCLEQSRLGTAAHLLSFFGSDTLEGIRTANHYYGAAMAGFSIPATEHSTITMWGEEHEEQAYESYVRKYLVERQTAPGVAKLAACVSDSFDVYRAIDQYWCGPRILPLIQQSGGTLVIRPDSGDPLEVLPRIFEILEARVGMRINSKGYKVLPDYFRVIQGDGIDRHSMRAILEKLTSLQISASNISFGSGGGLLQKVNRDTQKWAFKCCHAVVNGQAVDVRKRPVTDPGKRSKAGRLDLIRTAQGFETVALPEGLDAHPESAMVTVFDQGRITYDTTFAACRARMELR
ncbi:MAG: nicotinate phosphoribosyltransferase [Myxococcaceae bacterium]|nr:nicotinate phosphoribosyltransferase [Myxococcaceae bacterium]